MNKQIKFFNLLLIPIVVLLIGTVVTSGAVDGYRAGSVDEIMLYPGDKFVIFVKENTRGWPEDMNTGDYFEYTIDEIKSDTKIPYSQAEITYDRVSENGTLYSDYFITFGYSYDLYEFWVIGNNFDDFRSGMEAAISSRVSWWDWEVSVFNIIEDDTSIGFEATIIDPDDQHVVEQMKYTFSKTDGFLLSFYLDEGSSGTRDFVRVDNMPSDNTNDDSPFPFYIMILGLIIPVIKRKIRSNK